MTAISFLRLDQRDAVLDKGRTETFASGLHTADRIAGSNVQEGKLAVAFSNVHTSAFQVQSRDRRLDTGIRDGLIIDQLDAV